MCEKSKCTDMPDNKLNQLMVDINKIFMKIGAPFADVQVIGNMKSFFKQLEAMQEEMNTKIEFENVVDPKDLPAIEELLKKYELETLQGYMQFGKDTYFTTSLDYKGDGIRIRSKLDVVGGYSYPMFHKHTELVAKTQIAVLVCLKNTYTEKDKKNESEPN